MTICSGGSKSPKAMVLLINNFSHHITSLCGGWMPMHIQCKKCGKDEPVLGEPNTPLIFEDTEEDKLEATINNP